MSFFVGSRGANNGSDESVLEREREYGGRNENQRPLTTTPIQPPPRALDSISYGRLEETTTSIRSMADLQRHINPPASSSAYSTPTIEERQIRDDTQKHPPHLEKEERGMETEGGRKKSPTTNKATILLTAPSDVPVIKVESVYSGPTKTAYGHGYSEGYKQALADLQGHATTEKIEYPNPSVYKLSPEKQENIPQPLSVSHDDSPSKKTKSFFIRMLEKVGCASADADREHEESSMENHHSPAAKYKGESQTERGKTRI